MKTKLIIILLSLIALEINAQDCKHATWAKALGTPSTSNSIIEGGRFSDGTFTICGKFGNTDLVLDTMTVFSSGTYNWFIANHDSAGVFLKAQQVAWYSNSTDALTINKIDIGTDNSVYITGYWKGSTVHIADELLPTTTTYRMFVAKFDADLQYKWMRVSDWMSSDCYALDVASDKDKNVYVVGYYSDRAFKMGDDVVTKYGNSNTEGFFLKFDSLGTVKYLKNIGSYYNDYARVVVTDSVGDIYVMGTTGNSTAHEFHFDNQIAVPGGVISQTMFIGKYSGSDGHCIWGKMTGGYHSSGNMIRPYDACLGDNNSIVFCGQMSGKINLYPKTYSASEQCGFVSKMDADGNNLWLKTVLRTNYSMYSHANVRAVSYYNGDIAICGSLAGGDQPYVDEFPIYSLASGGGFIGFNAMYTTSGELQWTRGNSGYITTNCALIDNSGNQIIWGLFYGTATWYPLSLSNPTTSLQFYIMKYVPVAANPALTVSAGPDKVATCGSSVQLNGSITPSSGVNYGWFPNAGTSITPNVNPSSNTNYYLYASYQGCVKRDTVNVSYSDDTLTVNAGPDMSMCAGDSVQLITTCNDPTATFSWSSYSYINATTSQSPYVRPPISTVYTVTATNNGCKATDTVAVFVRDKPYIALPKYSTDLGFKRTMMCNGSTIDLNLGDPLNTYTIEPLSMVSDVNNNLATLHSIGGRLVVEATSQYGCTTKDSTLIMTLSNLDGPPIVGEIYDRSVCAGDSVNFEIMYFSDNQEDYDFQYGWFSGWQIDSLDGKGWRDISIWNKHFNIFNRSYGYPSSTFYSTLRIYTVNEDMDGFKFRPWINDYCSPRSYGNEAALRIGPKISDQPQNKRFCQGATDSISVNSLTSSTIYQWEIKQAGVFVPLIDKPDTIVANGRFLKLINASTAFDSIEVRCKLIGCTPTYDVYSKSALLTVIPPAEILFQNAKDTVCYYERGYFSVVVKNPKLYTFNWYENDTKLTYSTNHMMGYYKDTLSFTEVYYTDTFYTYKCRISNAQCATNVYTTPRKFLINPLPTVSWSGGDETICIQGTPLTLNGGLPSGGTYSGNDVASNIFSPDTAGTYPLTYTYTNEYNCSASAIKSYTINTCTDLSEEKDGRLTVANINKQITFFNASFFENSYSVSVYDMSGKCISHNRFSKNTTIAVINKNPLSVGIYYIKFSDGIKEKAFKLLVE